MPEIITSHNAGLEFQMVRYMKYQKAFTVILLAVSVILISCSKSKNSEADANEYFSFDTSKLGMEVVDQDMGIKFYPPIKWELRQTQISKKIESRGAAVKPEDNFIYKPTYVFFNDSTNGLLSVGKVETKDTSLAKSAQLNFYKGLIAAKYKDNHLTSVTFVHSKIYFSQLKLEKENLTSFKILFENSKHEIIELDYTIPSKYFESSYPFIKSSIGSIRPM